MPVDPAGTKPGLVAATPEAPPTIHLKCKRAPACDSILAIEVSPPNSSGRHMYRCVKCNNTWGIATGGAVDL